MGLTRHRDKNGRFGNSWRPAHDPGARSCPPSSAKEDGQRLPPVCVAHSVRKAVGNHMNRCVDRVWLGPLRGQSLPSNVTAQGMPISWSTPCCRGQCPVASLSVQVWNNSIWEEPTHCRKWCDHKTPCSQCDFACGDALRTTNHQDILSGQILHAVMLVRRSCLTNRHRYLRPRCRRSRRRLHRRPRPSDQP